MKFRDLRNWSNPASLEGLVFFAQLIEELLFDYSLDTYKPSAMNSSTLCSEALRLMRDVDAEVIDEANIKHVMKELIFTIRKDEVAKSLLSIPVDELSRELENDSIGRHDKRIIIQIIQSDLHIAKYKKRNEALLTSAVADGNQKNRIRTLARSYVTTLIAIGYDPSYLYPTARRFFFWGEGKITSADSINSFFDHFSNQDQKYVAIFAATKIFEELEAACKDFHITLSRTIPTDYEQYVSEKNFAALEGDVYLIVNEFDAKDVHSARSRAERKIEMISTLASLFHHKEIPRWREKALMINLKSKKSRVVSAPANPMLKCADLRAGEAAKKVSAFLNSYSFNEGESYDRFIRSAELHALALRNDAPENQLLNLWVALETLVPSNTTVHKAKVNNTIDQILPMLSMRYLPTLIQRLYFDIVRWDQGALSRAIRNISGSDDKERLLKLMFLQDHAAEKRELLNSFGHFYLLRNRFHYFTDHLRSTKKIAEILETHWQRVDWQIRRIYRARNSIIHAGATPSYVDILIKNLHDYLDTVSNTTIRLASDGDKINTIDQAFKYASICYGAYIRKLKTANNNLTQDSDISAYLLPEKLFTVFP